MEEQILGTCSSFTIPSRILNPWRCQSQGVHRGYRYRSSMVIAKNRSGDVPDFPTASPWRRPVMPWTCLVIVPIALEGRTGPRGPSLNA
jgi:hypothetical protein